MLSATVIDLFVTEGHDPPSAVHVLLVILRKLY